ncbi:hypothetical protein BDY21DRAFT_418240 [Lineolata rhizophorae]|uniref:Uncharacterized protein n=1 Tax=Lineolata rhizophorae TaxID=578093 RepID=A0A6A6PED5_9PEZI|nr:hypothetical protein BDY21DRAFT_418240 [Lineolata rhizophorae]
MRKRKEDAPSASPISDSEKTSKTTSPETRLGSSNKRGAQTPSSKPARLQPSEPLHMTTRAASRAVSNSAASSVASGDSRRNSLAEVSSESIDSVTGERSKSRRLSLRSDASHDSQNTPHSTAESPTDQKESELLTELREDARQTRKRKRSPEEPTSNGVNQSESLINGLENGLAKERKEKENGELLQPPLKRRGGRRSILTQDGTPAASADATPIPGTPNSTINLPPGHSQSGAETPNMEQPAKAVKRLPGRRRAPNPNVNIEADLRRQLHLKMGYRAVAKVLKPILDELAQRTLNDLENDPQLYKQYEEYDEIQAELRDRLGDRLTTVENQRKHKVGTLSRVMIAQEEMIRAEYINRVLQVQEDLLIHCQTQLLEIQRAYLREQDDDATDDEGNLVPRPRKASTKKQQQPAEVLGWKYDSRSRFYVEADQIWKDDHFRRTFQNDQSQFIDDDEEMDDGAKASVLDTTNFATCDGRFRDVRHAEYNMLQLAKASEDVGGDWIATSSRFVDGRASGIGDPEAFEANSQTADYLSEVVSDEN